MQSSTRLHMGVKASLSIVSAAARVVDTHCSWFLGSCFKDGDVLSNALSFSFPYKYFISRSAQNSTSHRVHHCMLDSEVPQAPSSPVALLTVGILDTVLVLWFSSEKGFTRQRHAPCARAGALLPTSKMFLRGSVAGRGWPAPLLVHVPWRSCHGRLAWGGLLHQLPQWHMGLWLQLNMPVPQRRSLQHPGRDLYVCAWMAWGEM